MVGSRRSKLRPRCNTTLEDGRKTSLPVLKEIRMKEIKAIIRPFKILDVVSELQKIENLPGVTISDIRGFGKSKAKDSKEKITEGLIAYVQKVKIEVVVPDEMVETIVSTIQANAHTGNPGDGKIFIYAVDDVINEPTRSFHAFGNHQICQRAAAGMVGSLIARTVAVAGVVHVACRGQCRPVPVKIPLTRAQAGLAQVSRQRLPLWAGVGNGERAVMLLRDKDVSKLRNAEAVAEHG